MAKVDNTASKMVHKADEDLDDVIRTNEWVSIEAVDSSDVPCSQPGDDLFEQRLIPRQMATFIILLSDTPSSDVAI